MGKHHFHNEKWFSMDGPNEWCSYAPKCATICRGKRQAREGGIMVWMLVIPNDLLTYKLLSKAQKLMTMSVYYRRQPQSKQELAESITEDFLEMNMNRRDNVIHLYDTYKRRLCEVIRNNGKLCNY